MKAQRDASFSQVSKDPSNKNCSYSEGVLANMADEPPFNSANQQGKVILVHKAKKQISDACPSPKSVLNINPTYNSSISQYVAAVTVKDTINSTSKKKLSLSNVEMNYDIDTEDVTIKINQTKGHLKSASTNLNNQSDKLNRTLASQRALISDNVEAKLQNSSSMFYSIKSKLKELKRERQNLEKETALLEHKNQANQIKSIVQTSKKNYLETKSERQKLNREEFLALKSKKTELLKKVKLETLEENQENVNRVKEDVKSIIKNFRQVSLIKNKQEALKTKKMSRQNSQLSSFLEKESQQAKKNLVIKSLNQQKLSVVKRKESQTEKISRLTKSLINDIDRLDYESKLCLKVKNSLSQHFSNFGGDSLNNSVVTINDLKSQTSIKKKKRQASAF